MYLHAENWKFLRLENVKLTEVIIFFNNLYKIGEGKSKYSLINPQQPED